MMGKGSFIRIGSATEARRQEMIEELFAKRNRNSPGMIVSPKQDLRIEQLRVF